MFFIGLILLAAAAVVGIDVAVVNGTGVNFEAFGHVFTTNTAAIFAAGVVVALVGCFGLFLMTDGAGRSARRRARRREVEAERDRLADEARRIHAVMDGQSSLDLRDRDEAAADETRMERAEADRSEHLNA